LEAWRLERIKPWWLGGLEAWRLERIKRFIFGGLEAWRLSAAIQMSTKCRLNVD
jgi:hypothetical protein